MTHEVGHCLEDVNTKFDNVGLAQGAETDGEIIKCHKCNIIFYKTEVDQRDSVAEVSGDGT